MAFPKKTADKIKRARNILLNSNLELMHAIKEKPKTTAKSGNSIEYFIVKNPFKTCYLTQVLFCGV